MRLSSLMVALIVFSAVFTGMFSFFVALPASPQMEADTTFNQTFDRFQSLVNQSQDVQDDIFSAEPTESNVLVLVGTGIVKALRGAFTSASVFTGMVGDAAELTVGIVPSWAWQTLVAVVTLLTLFALIYAFGGREA